MKRILTLIMAATCLQATAREVVKNQKKAATPLPLKGAVTATVGLGFVDLYRHYSLPMGYEKGNTTGFLPFYARVEYGVSQQFGIAATFGYDDLVRNYAQLNTGYNGVIRRYYTNKVRIMNAGIAGVYHFRPLSSVPRLHPFVSVGLALNNIRQDYFWQGDTVTTNRTTHTVTPVVKVGARYFISDQFSVYADGGLDNLGLVSLGFSCTFFSKKCGEGQVRKTETEQK